MKPHATRLLCLRRPPVHAAHRRPAGRARSVCVRRAGGARPFARRAHRHPPRHRRRAGRLSLHHLGRPARPHPRHVPAPGQPQHHLGPKLPLPGHAESPTRRRRHPDGADALCRRGQRRAVLNPAPPRSGRPRAAAGPPPAGKTCGRYEAMTGGINLGLDDNHAHVQSTGAYHYHALPTGLYERLAGVPADQAPAAHGAAGLGRRRLPALRSVGARRDERPQKPAAKSHVQLPREDG